jgi:hypothetical protein
MLGPDQHSPARRDHGSATAGCGDIPATITVLKEPDKLGGRWQGSDAIGGLNDTLEG